MVGNKGFGVDCHRLPVLRVIAPIILCFVASSCATDESRNTSRSDANQMLERLGIDICDEEEVYHSYGDGISRDFTKYYRREKGCSGDVYWYQYIREGEGRGFAYANDLDTLNYSLRRYHYEGKIVEILSGPNLLSNEQQDSNSEIRGFLDVRYEPGAIPPKAEDVLHDVGSIAGTVWDTSEPPDLISAFYFDDEGAMRIHDSNGLHTNASWEQIGNTIFIQMNDHYVEHYGIVYGDTMRGNSWHATGRRWTWVATRRRTLD